MTDMEKFIKLYASVGIKLKAEYYGELTDDGEMYLHMKVGYTKITGASEMETWINFDKNGKFQNQFIGQYMRITQIYSGFGWHLLKELKQKYNLNNSIDRNLPCLFFGIYGDSQIEKAIKP